MTFAMLEKDECETLVDFIEADFLPFVKSQLSTNENDSIEWVTHICSVWKKCKKVIEDAVD